MRRQCDGNVHASSKHAMLTSIFAHAGLTVAANHKSSVEKTSDYARSVVSHVIHLLPYDCILPLAMTKRQLRAVWYELEHRNAFSDVVTTSLAEGHSSEDYDNWESTFCWSSESCRRFQFQDSALLSVSRDTITTESKEQQARSFSHSSIHF